MQEITDQETTTQSTTQETQTDNTTQTTIAGKVKKEAKKHSKKKGHHKHKKKGKPQKKGHNKHHHHRHPHHHHRSDRNIEDNSFDNLDGEERWEAQKKLQRLNRDLFVANELEALLDKLSEETGNEAERSYRSKREDESREEESANFYKHQNSQYPKLLSDGSSNSDELNPVNEATNDDKAKRFLFLNKKRERKKKKSKSIWKQLFGLHENDDNRFLNQNFPNSQYANYPN